jgi:hypothetical protein
MQDLQLLKQLIKYINLSQISSLAMRRGITLWTHNKIWATTGSQRQRTMIAKKIMYVIFFTNQGPAIQIAAI